MHNYYNLFNRNKSKVRYGLILFGICAITAILIFRCDIFSKENVYFYTLSTIVQGFMALVAFLGTMVIFKIQVEDQAMQKLSDGIEAAVRDYRGQIVKTYTPTQMMLACQEIIKEKQDLGNKDFIEKIGNTMQETINSRRENRSNIVDFATFSFFNIGFALLNLLFVSVFIQYFWIGALLLSINIIISLFSLSMALEIVKKAMGYDFKI